MHPTLVTDLGGYLREQRIAARMSLRQLSDLAGISNPYLSQIERGLKKPSAEILQQIAHGLQLSAESLFVRAGILEEGLGHSRAPGVEEAIAADPHLTPRQRGVLIEVYRALRSSAPSGEHPAPGPELATEAGASTAPVAPEPTPETEKSPNKGENHAEHHL